MKLLLSKKIDETSKSPAAFRRLCVETIIWLFRSVISNPSRLQAAVC